MDPNTLNLDAAPESVPILIRIYAPILIRIQAFLHSYGLCTLYTVQYIINLKKKSKTFSYQLYSFKSNFFLNKPVQQFYSFKSTFLKIYTGTKIKNNGKRKKFWIKTMNFYQSLQVILPIYNLIGIRQFGFGSGSKTLKRTTYSRFNVCFIKFLRKNQKF